MTERPLVECVPNFSEGRDLAVIAEITAAIEAVDGVSLLDVDPGAATNRTVVTFVGSPNAVVEAAVAAGSTAAAVIDMAIHMGEHPRFGAMDVCPFVPVRGVSMDEVAALAIEAGRRLGEAGTSVYLYEHAATAPHRRNLASVRAGEYEGLEEKLQDPQWAPDFGPATLNPRAGATAVGARDFLVAYNVNLNTTSTRRANAVAFDVREKGRMQRSGDPLTGDIVRNEDDSPVWTPGSLRAVKAIGWFIDEYGIAQISMNLTDISVTPVHVAFDEVVDRAAARGLRVTGSEIVGMVPLHVLLDAGRHYLGKQQRSLGVGEDELVKIAVRSLGLEDLAPFDPMEKVIEYRLGERRRGDLVGRSVAEFVRVTAGDSPAPGGGSAAALAGALGAALGAMVANLSAHRRGWDHRWEEFSEWAVRGHDLAERLLELVDDDTAAFNAILEAWRLPSGTAAEDDARSQAVVAATRTAIEVPLQVMKTAGASFEVIAAMVETGLASSVTDAGVGALMARAAVQAAHLNVRVNAAALDAREAEPYLARAEAISAQVDAAERAALDGVDARLAADAG